MNNEELKSIKLLKLKYRRVRPNNSDFLQNWFPPEVRSPLFNSYIFAGSEKSTPDL